MLGSLSHTDLVSLKMIGFQNDQEKVSYSLFSFITGKIIINEL